MDIQKVGVVGGGIMGHNIAILIARELKIPVVIKEGTSDWAETALAKVRKYFDERLEWGKIDRSDAEMGKALITATASYDELKDADLVIEAVSENLALKKEIFSALDAILPQHALIASNTSSLSITELADATKRPDQFAGLHFFNPPIKMPLVELVRGSQTSEETLDALQNFSESLGKTVIRVKDVPGFLVNRLLMPYLNTAAKAMETMELTPEQIDAEAVEIGWPMGPFFLMDYVGLDVASAVADVLNRGYGDRMVPSKILNLMVSLKRFGVKNKVGFYKHDTELECDPIEEVIGHAFPSRSAGDARSVMMSMMKELAQEAQRCLDEGVASAEDLEIGCAMGIHFPDGHGGPIGWAKENGLIS